MNYLWAFMFKNNSCHLSLVNILSLLSVDRCLLSFNKKIINNK